jgi:hypothetical protein
MHLARSYAQSPPGSGRGCIVREVVIDLFSTRSTLAAIASRITLALRCSTTADARNQMPRSAAERKHARDVLLG